MKKSVMIPFCLLFIAGLMAIVIPMVIKIKYYAYEREITNLMGKSTDYSIVATDDSGEKTYISEPNSEKLMYVLTVSERKVKYGYNKTPEKSIVLTFENGDSIMIYQEDNQDKAVVVINTKGSHYISSIEGYETYKWVKKTISLEGYWGENLQYEEKN